MGSVKAIKSMIEEAGGPDVRRQRLVLRDGTMLQDDSHASDIPPGEGVTVVEMQPQTVKLTGVVRRRLTLIGDERANDDRMVWRPPALQSDSCLRRRPALTAGILYWECIGGVAGQGHQGPWSDRTQRSLLRLRSQIDTRS